jgi:hypothetical protein
MELNQKELKLVADMVNDSLESIDDTWDIYGAEQELEEIWELIELGIRIVNDSSFDNVDIDRYMYINQHTNFADDMVVDWSEITDDVLLLTSDVENPLTTYSVRDFLTATKVNTNGYEFYHLHAIDKTDLTPVVIVMDHVMYDEVLEAYNEQK